MTRHEIRGQGPDLVMVHGWGMHAGVWSDWADSLADQFRVHLLELPGHGCSDDSVGASIGEWSAALARRVTAPAVWMGWSLGALLCVDLARRQPGQVRSLVLIAATPRFVRAADWPYAVDGEVFDQFETQLQQDPQRTLLRFLSLQMRTAEGGSDGLRRLRTLLSERPAPRSAALSDGLALLRDSDLRAAVAELACPLYWMLGERDTLVPSQVGERLPGRTAIIPGAGHAPFLSHPALCSGRVRDWLADMEGRDRHAAV